MRDRSRRTMAMLALLAAFAAGCGRDRGSRTVIPRDGGTRDGGVSPDGAPRVDAGPGVDAGPRVDAGTGPDAGRDGGSPPGGCDGLPPAMTTPTGTRTAYPGISYIVEFGYALRTINFIHDGTRMHVLAEVANNTGSAECDFFPDMTFDGIDLYPDIVETPPHYTSVVSTVTNDCLSAGDVGVVYGRSSDITLDDLSSGTLVLDMSPSTIGTPYRATNGPTILSSTPTMTAEGWVVRGQIRPMVAVRNYSLATYARDSRGLLIGELLAFPMMLGTLPAGSTVDYEGGDPIPCPFTEVLQFQSWIID